MNYWLFKSEPSTFSFDELKKKGKTGTQWDGVRNYQARNNMRAMQVGDLGFYYHSNEGLNVVGIAEVCAPAHHDTTTEDERWECVDIRAVPRDAKPADARSDQGQRETGQDGSCGEFPSFGSAGDAGRMEGSLPHGRAGSRRPDRYLASRPGIHDGSFSRIRL